MLKLNHFYNVKVCIYIDRFAKNVINDTRQEEVLSFISHEEGFEFDKLEFNEQQLFNFIVHFSYCNQIDLSSDTTDTCQLLVMIILLDKFLFSSFIHTWQFHVIKCYQISGEYKAHYAQKILKTKVLLL